MKRVLTIFLSGLASLSAMAQDAPIRMTFKDAVKIGLENNMTLNQQENTLLSTRMSKTAAMLGFGPTVTINGSAGRNDGNSFNQQQGQVVNGVVDFVSANINASMPLFNAFNTVNLYRQNNNLYEAQLHQVKRTSQDVIRNVASQFLTCVLDQKLVAIQEKNLETQKQTYNQIKEQVAAGGRAEVDLYNQEYQVKNAELLLLRSNITLRNDKTTLAQTLQIDPLIPFELEEPNWDVNAADADTMTLEAMSELAESQRSDLAQAKYTEKANKHFFQASKGGYYPNVSLFAQYGSRYNYIHSSKDYNPDNRTFEQQFAEDNTQLTYGVSFSIPIIGGFQSRSTVVRNRMTYENSKLAQENTKIQVKGDVLRAHQNYRDARTSFASATAQKEAAEKSYTLEKERYELGISDIVALTLATQNYTRAQSDYESARYTLMFQKLLLNYATGTLRFEDIP
jgi:outer membrane protein